MLAQKSQTRARLAADDWTNPLPGVPDVESPFFEDLFARIAGEDGWLNTARALRQNGFAVIDFPDPKFEKVADRIKGTSINRLICPEFLSRQHSGDDLAPLPSYFRPSGLGRAS